MLIASMLVDGAQVSRFPCNRLRDLRTLTGMLKRSRSTAPLLVFVVAAVLPYAPALLNPGEDLGKDWDYFNALSLLVRSVWLQNGALPVHDPWVGGGLDILANPQNRVFSPYALLDLVFVPQWANLLSLMCSGFFGLWGMFRFLRRLGASRESAIVGSICFIWGSWFGLHFAEGHIVFGTMQLLPWVGYFGLRLTERRSWIALALLFSFFLLDGGIYTLIFSGFLIASLIAIGLVRLKRILAREHLVWGATSIAIFLLLGSAKLLPVLALHSNRAPVLDFLEVPVEWVVTIFLYPLLTNLQPASFSSHLRMHEFGTYLGFAASCVVLAALATRRFRAFQLRFFLPLLFWAWVGLGWGGSFNAWHLVHRIPLVNNAHVQSRVLLLSFFFFVCLIAFAMDRLRARGRSSRAPWVVVALLLITESLFVRLHPLEEMFERLSHPRVQTSLIQFDTIRSTVRSGSKPMLYRSDLAVVYSYEPASTATNAQHRAERSYRGEIYPIHGHGILEIAERVPGRVVIRRENDERVLAEINTNWLAGWRCAGGTSRAFETSAGLVGVVIPAGRGEIVLVYSPWYLAWMWPLLLAGLVLATVALLKSRRPARTKPPHFDYSSIPIGYYDEILHSGRGVRKVWHLLKFERIRECLPADRPLSILDIGCFSGTFLSLLPEHPFHRQLGLDIIEPQIAYASDRYGTRFREFRYIQEIRAIEDLGERFDVITLIEVIEHLRPEEVAALLHAISSSLEPGGRLVLSTPNYASAWPLIEFLLNRWSSISYEEQHITRFTYFNFRRRLAAIYPDLDSEFEIEIKTTTHFAAPFLAAFSERVAIRLSRAISHQRWIFPFGNLILVALRKKQ